MSDYITIGYVSYGRCRTPVEVKEGSVSSDKEIVIPRIMAIFNLFSENIPKENRDDFLKMLIQNTILVDGRDPGAQRLLRGRWGMYSSINGNTYIDSKHTDCPSLIEHELIHHLGETYLSHLPPRRVINQHKIAANIATTLFDDEDVLGYHRLGEADDMDFHKLILYRLVPIEFQKMLPGFRKTCKRIGNYAREKDKGKEILHRLSR